MKINKIFMIVQLSLMYLSLLCCYLIAIPLGANIELPQWASYASLITAISGVVIASLFSIAIMIISFISIFKKEAVDQTKFVMIYKIIAIPYFIGNFIFCALVIAGMLNPFLFLAAPIVAGIFMFFTYVNMLGSSVVDVAYVINSFKNKTLKPHPLVIIGIILEFIFCVDFLGAIFIFLEKRKQINN